MPDAKQDAKADVKADAKAEAKAAPSFVPAVMTPAQATALAIADEIKYNRENGITFGGEVAPGGRFLAEDGVTLHDAHGFEINSEADERRSADRSRAEAEANERAVAAILAREGRQS